MRKGPARAGFLFSARAAARVAPDDQPAPHPANDNSCTCMGTKMANDPSKEVTITNKSGSAVSVMTVMTDPALDKSGGTPVAGTNLSLYHTTDGTRTVANNESGTYFLNQYYEDPDTGQPAYWGIYDLLVSDALNYAPVANIGLVYLGEKSRFPAQTVSADQKKAQDDAARFIQTVSAYPTSQLAKNFQAALDSTGSAAGDAADGSADSSKNVAHAIDAGINAFFQKTKQFQDVTMAAYIAVHSYYQDFPCVWAGFADSTYYLYSSDGKKTSFAGTLSLSRPASLDVTQPNAGYVCVFAPARNPDDTNSVDVDDSKKVALVYQQGLFQDDVDSDTPDIAVKGTFYLKRFFTRKTTDTSVIPVLSGAVYGAVCIGFNQPQKSGDKDNSAFWNSLFHPKNSAEIFKSVMTIGGAVMMLAFFGMPVMKFIYNAVRTRLYGKEPTTRDLLDSQRKAIEDSFKKQLDEATSKLSNGKEKPPEDVEAAQETIESGRGSVNDNLDAASLGDAVDGQAATLETVAEYESSMSSEQLVELQNLGGKVSDAASKLSGATPEELHEVVAEQGKAIEGLQAQLEQLTKQLDSILSEQARETIDGNAEQATEAQKEIDDAEKDGAEDDASTDPEAEDPIIPEV